MAYPEDPQENQETQRPSAAQQVGQFAADQAKHAASHKVRQIAGKFAANGAKAAGKLALQALPKIASLLGGLTTIAPYILGIVAGAILLILLIAIIFNASPTSPAGIARSEIMVVGGDGFGESGSMYCLNPLPAGTSSAPAPEFNPGIINRAQEIASSLLAGFWGYYNHSPLYDGPEDPYDFWTPPANDMDRLNRDAYGGNSPNLFWCTYLIIRAYSESNHSWSPTSARSDLMMQEFCDRGKFVDAAIATESQLVPGSVIFFHVLSGPSRVNHVAMVTGVTGGQVTFIQSNAGTIDGSFPLGSTMLGSNMQIIGFGLP